MGLKFLTLRRETKVLRINKLIKDFDYKGEFLNSSNLEDLMYGIEFSSFSELIDYLNGDDNNYISDKITELSDSMVDIYYYILREWSVNNYNYIEDAISEFGVDTKNPDFHKMIQMGQYLAFSTEFYSMVDEFKDYIVGQYNV